MFDRLLLLVENVGLKSEDSCELFSIAKDQVMEEGFDMIGFLIWSIVAAVFMGIGIGSRKSEQAVGFFTGVKPPAMRDVKKYNHAVSMLWFISAVLFEIMGVPLLFLEQNSPVFMFVIFGVVFLIIGMIIGYLRIETKYKE